MTALRAGDPDGKPAGLTMVVMTFFDEPSLQTPEPEEPEPQRTPWRGTSDDTTGVVVPLVRVLARTDDVVVIVSAFVAYPAGFDFTLITISRLAWTRRGMQPHPMGFGVSDRMFASPEFLRFGLRFADGSKATNVGFGQGGYAPGSGVRDLLPRGSGGGGRKYSSRYWCEPLPPPGPLGLVCEWPKYGIAETEDVVSADLILAAAEQAKPIWPDDVGIPEPPGRQYPINRSSAHSATFSSSYHPDS
jgi:hypothetical protein